MVFVKHYIDFFLSFSFSAHSTREDGLNWVCIFMRQATTMRNKEAHDAESNVNVLPMRGAGRMRGGGPVLVL